MLFDAVAAPIFLLALTLPFVFGYTQPPISNFWPLTVSWACGVLVLLLCLARRGHARYRSKREQPACEAGGLNGHVFIATQLAEGLLLAALLSCVIGLAQYFGGDLGLAPWLQASTPGQAIGNLRQRNQQATLISLGAWALLWILAQIQVRLETREKAVMVQQALLGGGRPWPAWLVGILLAWGIALLAIGGAATTSRTGAAQWILIMMLLVLWRASCGRAALGLSLAGVLLYAMAAWLLPHLLLNWTGFTADGLFSRILGEGEGCTSRSVLWQNVLYLIAKKPWLGWGWGELDYAHYVTLFPGDRFCVLLDNAHNLPLHLAVELGLPVAVLVCTALGVWLVRAKPWRETDPVRQLAWGILAIVGLHSMLEFPLWYGPFQLVSVLAMALLWRGALPRWAVSPAAKIVGMGALVGVVVAGGVVALDYYRVSMLYRPVMLRPAAYREDTVAKVSDTVFFTDQVDFSLLSTTPLTKDRAPQIHVIATALLHFSPEPRVIEAVIESSLLMGNDDEAAFHMKRYRIAYPAEYARWRNAAEVAPRVP
ncbi:pilin glycosylation ligase PglL [Acidovorax sp. 99]|uniref:Wzy polymerase domain-containing protein n=1 Tax=Acidovorax sp. 99 TaxID=2135634 RepID=UPI000D5F5773|nr:Wzy polymerase domain-containing protein [Acidovorax sp. 99]PVY90278.1 pilin glycosylation ligase PglL [Acidovorax sp. 99]